MGNSSVDNVENYLKQSCRVCLEDNLKVCISIESSTGIGPDRDRPYTLCEAFVECTNISISTSDEFSQQICLPCAEELKSCLRFLCKAREAYKLLLFQHGSGLQEIPITKPVPTKVEVSVLEPPTLDEVSSSPNPTFTSSFDDDLVVVLQDDPLANGKEKKSNATTKPRTLRKRPRRRTGKSTKRRKKIIKEDNVSDHCRDSGDNGNDCVAHNSDSSLDLNSSTEDKTLKELRNNKPPVKNSDQTSDMEEDEGSDPEVDHTFCHLCCIKFSTSSNRRRHDRSVHQKIQRVDCTAKKKSSASSTTVCFKCKCPFNNLGSLRLHLKHMHKNLRLKCPVCDQKFHNKSKLNRHIVRQHTEKPCEESKKKTYFCDVCGRFLSSSASLERHIKEVHLKIKNKKEPKMDLKCTICQNLFSSISSLYKHMHKLHNKIEDDEDPTNKLKCKECGKQFTSGGHLNRHRSEIHENKARNSFPCRNCNRYFQIKQKRNQHENICAIGVVFDDEPRGFRCEFCDKVFVRSIIYERHMEKEHKANKSDNTLQCIRCNQVFSNRALLSKHIVSHMKFHCKLCARKYERADQLEKHATTCGSSKSKNSTDFQNISF